MVFAFLNYKSEMHSQHCLSPRLVPRPPELLCPAPVVRPPDQEQANQNDHENDG